MKVLPLFIAVIVAAESELSSENDYHSEPKGGSALNGNESTVLSQYEQIFEPNGESASTFYEYYYVSEPEGQYAPTGDDYYPMPYSEGGSAPTQDASELSSPDPEGWYVPTQDGNFTWVFRQQLENESIPMKKCSSNVLFYLYTRSNRDYPQQLYVNDVGTLINSNFRKSLPTRVISHGWLGDYSSHINTVIRQALLGAGSFNVIVIDWGDVALDSTYFTARWAVPDIGLQVALFLDFLNAKGGMRFNKLALYGYSLGAHVVGFVGKQVKRGKVNTIIGLDPSSALYSYSDCSKRLCKSDATYVESIQTNGRLLGFLRPIGKAAFYPNGGQNQPGCGVDLTGQCAHERSYMYLAEAVSRNSFISIECSSYLLAISGLCWTDTSVRMGTGFGNEGVFYVAVNSEPPFGMG